MSRSSRDHSYTVNLADQALGLIKSYQLPADPPSFEVWYTYAGRLIPAFNQAINDLLDRTGTISAAEADRVYDQHIGAFGFGERIGKIGEEVGDEITRIVGMIDWAIGSAERYETKLSNLDEDLSVPKDPTALRAIVANLVRATKLATDESKNHKTNLEAARLEIRQLHKTLDAVRVESRTDPLTGLANRKQFDMSLEKAICAAGETSKPLTLVMLDVDHFKIFNDTWGHPLGDDVLRLIARFMKQSLRQLDVAARYGGEEFASILPDTDLQQGVTVAERLREAIMAKAIIQRSSGRNLGRVSVSIGVAQWQAGEPARQIVERADACLYAAKAQGRNRVIWQSSPIENGPARSSAA